MRIAYLVLGKDIAGGEIVCLQLMRAAREQGHEVCILVPDAGSVMDIAIQEGFETYILPLERTFQLHKSLSLARFLKYWHADLLHTHTMLPGMILARIGAALAGVSLISHAHAPNVFSQAVLIRTLQHILDKLTQQFCQATIAVSEDTRFRLIQQGNPTTIQVIPNGIQVKDPLPSSIVEEFRSKWGINQTTFTIGCIARLERNKGQHDLILAAAKLKQKVNLDVKYIFLGNDSSQGSSYLHEIQQSAAAIDILESIVFVGFHPNAAQLVSTFNIFVLPSYREAMPMSILEAMAAAKPVVATNVNGIPEVVVDGVTGFLVQPGNPEALAEAILKLLQNPQMARDMGIAGQKRVQEHFNLDKLHEQVFALYDKVTAKRHG